MGWLAGEGIVCKLGKYIKVQLGRNKKCHNIKTNGTRSERKTATKQKWKIENDERGKSEKKCNGI